MTEKQLISKLKELEQIKPREHWVVFTKKQLFEAEKRELGKLKWFSIFEPEVSFVFHHKPVFAFLVVLLVLIGVFGFAQNSVPGDTLFSIKKIAEKSQAVFVSEKNQPKHNLELANKRLDDLTKIAETNQNQKLVSAITEYQETVSKAAESLGEAEVGKDLVSAVKKIEEKTEKIKSYGIEIGENQELDNALAQIVKREIDNLETQELTEEQKEVLNKIKQNYEDSNYSDALESLVLVF